MLTAFVLSADRGYRMKIQGSLNSEVLFFKSHLFDFVTTTYEPEVSSTYCSHILHIAMAKAAPAETHPSHSTAYLNAAKVSPISSHYEFMAVSKCLF